MTTALSMATGNRTHGVAVRGDDLYETPPEAVRALLSVEPVPLSVWEPACGPGAIIGADPLLAPALSRDDGLRLARRGAGLDPHVDLRAKGGIVQDVCPADRAALAQRLIHGMADGLAEAMDNRIDRLRLCGNGVHALAGAAAYRALRLELEHRASARGRAGDAANGVVVREEAA